MNRAAAFSLARRSGGRILPGVEGDQLSLRGPVAARSSCWDPQECAGQPRALKCWIELANERGCHVWSSVCELGENPLHGTGASRMDHPGSRSPSGTCIPRFSSALSEHSLGFE